MSEVTRVTQDFLDSSQYLESSILQYESIYGEDFVSPGGRELASEMIAGMALAPGSRVLDVGCGLGGSAFVMAKDFGLQVDAIDLSRNMLALAERKLAANGLADRVSLQWGDCLELDCSDRYDAIYSRDVFLHIADKARLFPVLNAALKPGGQLLFTDYCCARKPWSDEFGAYVQERGYILHTTDEYAELIVLIVLSRFCARNSIESIRCRWRKRNATSYCTAGGRSWSVPRQAISDGDCSAR